MVFIAVDRRLNRVELLEVLNWDRTRHTGKFSQPAISLKHIRTLHYSVIPHILVFSFSPLQSSLQLTTVFSISFKFPTSFSFFPTSLITTVHPSVFPYVLRPPPNHDMSLFFASHPHPVLPYAPFSSSRLLISSFLHITPPRLAPSNNSRQDMPKMRWLKKEVSSEHFPPTLSLHT